MLKPVFNVLLFYYEISCYQVPAGLSSSQYFMAALARQSKVVRCRTVLCCAVLRAVLHLILRSCRVSFDDVWSSSTEAHRTKFVRTPLLNLEKLSRFISAQL